MALPCASEPADRSGEVAVTWTGPADGSDDRVVRVLAPPPAPWRPRRRSWPVVLALIVGFAVTRAPAVLVTFDPSLYGDIASPLGDVGRYGAWATAIVRDGLAPYREIDIEYPPGSLPFLIVPALLGGATFMASAFVWLMVALDIGAFCVLVSMARRGRSYAGVALWLLLPPLLGVVLYGRLDLVPAVALLVALERAHAHRWLASGTWLGLGTAAKLVPVLFLPLLLAAAKGRRARVLAGAGIGVALAWLPFAGDTGEMLHDVVGYHSARGIHLESLWGALLNLQRIAGGPADLVFAHGAFHITGDAAPQMLRWTTILSVAIVVAALGAAVVRWRGRAARARAELPLAVTATLALLLGTGRVFSPQFVVWLLAAAAVLLAVRPRLGLWAGPLLAVIVLLTVAGYPLGFEALVNGERWPAMVVLWRNLSVLTLGIALTLAWLLEAHDPHA